VDIDNQETKMLLYRRRTGIPSSMSLSEPEGEGLTIHAVDFQTGNLVYNPEFGLLIDGGKSPAYAAYAITLPYDGNYELWVRYATQQERPVDIYLDNALIKSEALIKFTPGWHYAEAQWSKEADIEAKNGKHTLKLVAEKTPFPHIDLIKIIYKPDQQQN